SHDFLAAREGPSVTARNVKEGSRIRVHVLQRVPASRHRIGRLRVEEDGVDVLALLGAAFEVQRSEQQRFVLERPAEEVTNGTIGAEFEWTRNGLMHLTDTVAEPVAVLRLAARGAVGGHVPIEALEQRRPDGISYDDETIRLPAAHRGIRH